MHLKAPITNISKGSLHDGPGVRTVVYFKGCMLRCKWCHNPETLSAGKEILFMPSKCIHCGKCIAVCPECHKIVGNDIIFERDGCAACGQCADVCPSRALELCGAEKTVGELFEEIKNDLHYYRASGGGVTFSGGECLLYADFVAELAELCIQNGISTAVESAFFVPFENAEKTLPHIDLFFADLKIPDNEKHKKYTGQGNKTIIENIKRLSELHDNVTLRIPVIPGVNNSGDDISAFAEIINTLGKGVRRVELLKYNNLAKSKYLISGKEYTEFASAPQQDEEMRKLCALLGGKINVECFFV